MDFSALAANGVVQFDGGFGSQVAARGLAFDCPERLNLSHPDDVRAVHRAYVEAGAQVVETNTLGANPIRLDAHGLSGDMATLVAAAVGHARAAGAPAIACSMGTTTAFLEPFGPMTFDEALRCFCAQATAAAAAGADILFTETLTDLAEARAMWLAARAAGLPFAASFTFMPNGRTLTGSTPAVCAVAAEAMGASLVGVNCVGDAALLLAVIAEMRGVTRLPIVAQPNAGLPEEIDGRLVYTVTPEALLQTMREAVNLGAAAIGGCCGTTPSHIRLMASLSNAAPIPAPGGDGVRRVCSQYQCLPLAEAFAACETMTPDDLDASDAPAVLLDLRGVSPTEAVNAVQEARIFLRQPLLLRAGDAETLAAALRVYPGVAGVDAPFDVPGFGALPR